MGAIVISSDGPPKKLVQLPKVCSTSADRALTKEEISEKVAYFCKKYSCISDSLPTNKPFIKDVEMKINLKDNLPSNIPKFTTSPVIPKAYEKHGRKLFKELEESGQIKRVPLNHNTQFCSRAFILPKHSDIEKYGPRLVIDYSHLNQYINRSVHPFQGGSEILKKLSPKAKYFATLDALHGYFTIRLAPESQHVTTFISPFGSFVMTCAPMGLACSSDIYNNVTDSIILPSSPNVHKLVDDILVFGETPEELYNELDSVLQACQKNNITLKKSKFTIGETVKFSGFNISKNGITPTKERVECITKFPAPVNRHLLKSFLGMARVLAHFTPDLAYAEQGLRLLDSNRASFLWTEIQQQSFDLVKDILSGPLVLKNFDSSRETQLQTDASRSGLGFALMQADPATGHYHMIHCGSRALTPAERNYSVCCLELLAVAFALSKCRHWLLGFPDFTVVTDHAALCGLFKKDLSEMATPRLRRLREKCVEFSFKVEYRRGSENCVADALSRAPLWPMDFELSDPEDHHVCNLIKSEITDPLLQPLITAANKCENYQKLITAIQTFKRFEDIPANHCAKQYAKVWRDLSIHENGLVTLNLDRIVVPEKCRDQVLETLHKAHCGETKSKLLAKQRFYWPTINNSIDQLVHNCAKCRPLLPSQQHEPVKSDFKATFPMSHVASDIFSIGTNYYLVLICRYSGFPFCQKLKNITAETVLDQLYTWFCEHGFPVSLRSDQGKQYTAEVTADFCKKYNIVQEFSSPHHPQSNGLSESAVKQMKFLMLKSNEKLQDFKLALQHWRNTPSHTGYSPSQLFLCRAQRTLLPVLPQHLELNPECAILGSYARKEFHQQLCDKRVGRELKPLVPGQRVFVQNLQGLSKRPRWDNLATVIAVNPSGASYVIELDTGEKFSRNRVYLRPVRGEACITDDAPETTADQTEPVHNDTPRRSARLQARNADAP